MSRETHLTGLEPEIYLEGRCRIGNTFNASPVARCERLTINKREQRCGMDIGYIPVTAVLTAVLIRDTLYVKVIYTDRCHLTAGKHTAAGSLNHIFKCIGQLSGTALKPAGVIHEQGRYHYMDIGRRVSGNTCVERIDRCQHGTEFRITDILGYECVGRHEELIGVVIYTAHALQIEEFLLMRYAEHGINVTAYVIFLVGKLTCQIVYECLTAGRKVISASAVGVSNAQHHVGRPNLEPIHNAKIAAQAVQDATLVETACHMHAGLKGLAAACECL